MSSDRQTFHESWYRVAEVRPRLRAAVQTYRQHFRGRRWHVVQDPSNHRYFRLDEAAYHFVSLLDGRRTVADAWRICVELFGDAAPTQAEAINVLGQLHRGNLLQSDLPSDAAGMFEHQREETRRRIGGVLSNLLFIRVPLFNPDALLERWEWIGGLVFRPFALVGWLVLLIVAGVSLLGRVDEFAGGVSGVIAPENLFLLYVSFVAIKVVHEFGHAFATKHIGRRTGSHGSVPTLGVTLMVFTPMPYVDASSAWAFRSKWHRALVGAAGMYAELAVAAVAAIVWANTSPGLVHAIAYNVVFVAGFSTVLFNANPLLRFDGYYILSDLCEVPNLANRSRDLIKSLLKRRLLRLSRVPEPALDGAERWWLPIYGVAAAVYRVVITVGIILFIVDKLFIIGVLLAISGMIGGIVLPCTHLLRYLATNPELARGRLRACVTVAVITITAVIGLGVVPAPAYGRSEGLIEPVDVHWVFAETDGFVDAVLQDHGVMVALGAPLLTATNYELETKRTRLVAERRIAELERDRARMGETALAQSLDDRLAALDDQIARMERRQEALRVRAPAAGRWIAPEADRLDGAFVERGRRLGMVADVERLFVRAVADQRLGPRLESEVGVGALVQVRVRGRPDLRLEGTLREVLPAGSHQLPSAALGYLGGGFTPVATDDSTGTTSTEPFFEVHVELDGAAMKAGRLCSGQRVVVRFELPRRPLLTQAWRGLRQLVQRRFQV